MMGFTFAEAGGVLLPNQIITDVRIDIKTSAAVLSHAFNRTKVQFKIRANTFFSKYRFFRLGLMHRMKILAGT